MVKWCSQKGSVLILVSRDDRSDVYADKRVYGPVHMGIFKGEEIPWNEVLKEYYSIRGWSEKGLPTKEKLRELQIEDLANGLEL